jgi:hypothetical protein
MANSDILRPTLGQQIAALGTQVDTLQSQIRVQRESDYSRFETIQAELVALRDLLARAIAERNRAIADLARQTRGGDLRPGDLRRAKVSPSSRDAA